MKFSCFSCFVVVFSCNIRDRIQMDALDRSVFIQFQDVCFLEYIMSTLFWYQQQDQLYYTDNTLQFLSSNYNIRYCYTLMSLIFYDALQVEQRRQDSRHKTYFFSKVTEHFSTKQRKTVIIYNLRTGACY